MSVTAWVPSRESWMERFGDWFVPEPNTGCWLWTGTSSGTYPQKYASGRTRLAHRLSYQLLRGPIPAGMQLDHLCRTPFCVNPDHLEVVTARVNTLRGNTPAAANAAKTHCPAGHEYSPENTYIDGGSRCCKACHRRHQRDYLLRREARRLSL